MKPLSHDVPPSRDTPRFMELFGRTTVEGQMQEMVEEVLERVFCFVSLSPPLRMSSD